MDPTQLLNVIAPQIKEIARTEADRAALAALKKAQGEMMIGFVLAVVAAVFIGKVWK